MGVCDPGLLQRQTYDYLPSKKASPPFDRYQIALWQKHKYVKDLSMGLSFSDEAVGGNASLMP